MFKKLVCKIEKLGKNHSEIIDANRNLRTETYYLKKALLKQRHFSSTIESAKNIVCSCIHNNMQHLWPDKNLFLIKDKYNLSKIPDAALLWGEQPLDKNINLVNYAFELNIPIYIGENGFLRSAYGWADDKVNSKLSDGISYLVSAVQYFDSTECSPMEKILNDSSFTIREDEKVRARRCIDFIVSNNLTKYNHQPIFTPEIGRKNAKKVLVVDQAYRDMSISKGMANDYTFKDMLEKAIEENPDADIIVKTHPDTIAGTRGGYYTELKAHDNVYTMTDTINPLSIVKYVDKVYVCSSQLGFEALMCGREVHTFGMPFYAGWGLTIDDKKCYRRTNKRSLEEIFYIAYILETIYINPDKKCRCEIEEAMDYLLKLRDEYFFRKKGS